MNIKLYSEMINNLIEDYKDINPLKGLPKWNVYIQYIREDSIIVKKKHSKGKIIFKFKPYEYPMVYYQYNKRYFIASIPIDFRYFIYYLDWLSKNARPLGR